MSAPSCETCKDTKWITGADAMPCPDCQPKPRERVLVIDDAPYNFSCKPSEGAVSEPYITEQLLLSQEQRISHLQATIERQAGEISALDQERIINANEAHAAKQLLLAREADLASARLNERRYLWLRDLAYWKHEPSRIHTPLIEWSRASALCNDGVDSAIDAAIAGDGK